MTKMNKGEWGEPYVALRLLADGRLPMADEHGSKRSDEWMEVIGLIRREAADRVVRYNRNPETLYVDIDVNGSPVVSLPASDFTNAADSLASDIASGRGTFEASDEVTKFLCLAEMVNLKAKSEDKSDIFLTTLDPRSAIKRDHIGFSIKSKFGHNPTLFNTARASAVRYEVKGMTSALAEKINSMVDGKGHTAVATRCKALLEAGCQLQYVGYAWARNAKCEAFKENLDVIDPRLPLVIERILWNHFFEGDPRVDLEDVVGRIIQENPCHISRPDVKYPYMIKSFLYAAYCGMTASTLWDGTARVNGGFITVDENGGILANYALDSEEFKAYLFHNCYLEFPATSRGHGDYAKVYEEDGSYYFHLNFQIRYR